MGVTRWGILGAAKFARQHMGPAIALAQGAELAAVATRSPEKAVPFQSLAPGLCVHASYQALLDDPAIDAVYIPLPNDMHTPWAIRALEAGKAALVEKPAALSVAELDGLIAARDRFGVLAAEAFMIVHHPQWAKARALVQEGAIGPLRRVSGVFTYDNRADPGNIRNQSARGGGGVRDIGVYPFGAVRFVSGQEPLSIEVETLQVEQGVDVTAHMRADFEGFVCHATTSMRMSRWQGMEFQGEAGVIRMSAPFNPGVFGEARLELHDAAGGCRVFRWPAENQYVLQVEAFQRAMTGAAFACPLEFSRGTQAMIDRILTA